MPDLVMPTQLIPRVPSEISVQDFCVDARNQFGTQRGLNFRTFVDKQVAAVGKKADKTLPEELSAPLTIFSEEYEKFIDEICQDFPIEKKEKKDQETEPPIDTTFGKIKVVKAKDVVGNALSSEVLKEQTLGVDDFNRIIQDSQDFHPDTFIEDFISFATDDKKSPYDKKKAETFVKRKFPNASSTNKIVYIRDILLDSDKASAEKKSQILFGDFSTSRGVPQWLDALAFSVGQLKKEDIDRSRFFKGDVKAEQAVTKVAKKQAEVKKKITTEPLDLDELEELEEPTVKSIPSPVAKAEIEELPVPSDDDIDLDKALEDLDLSKEEKFVLDEASKEKPNVLQESIRQEGLTKAIKNTSVGFDRAFDEFSLEPVSGVFEFMNNIASVDLNVRTPIQQVLEDRLVEFAKDNNCFFDERDLLHVIKGDRHLKKFYMGIAAQLGVIEKKDVNQASFKITQSIINIGNEDDIMRSITQSIKNALESTKSNIKAKERCLLIA